MRKPFLEVCGDLNVVVGILCSIHFCYSCQFGTEPVALLLTGCKLFMAYFGQFSHMSAHNVTGRGPIANGLQKAGIMISFKDHHSHHTPPHDTDFCLVGVCNPIIQAARSVCSNDTAWLALFLAWSILDVKLATAAIHAVL